MFYVIVNRSIKELLWYIGLFNHFPYLHNREGGGKVNVMTNLEQVEIDRYCSIKRTHQSSTVLKIYYLRFKSVRIEKVFLKNVIKAFLCLYVK